MNTLEKPRVLVAGIGNIFYGDDAFGVEVVRALRERCELHGEVLVKDFGIRGYDLAYAIDDGHEAVILVDAAPRGDEPGTLYLLELDSNHLDEAAPPTVDAHSLDPVAVLQLVRALGTAESLGKLYLVGCEPAVLECEDGEMGLSPPVAAAVPGAIEMILARLADEFSIRPAPAHNPNPGLLEAAT